MNSKKRIEAFFAQRGFDLVGMELEDVFAMIANELENTDFLFELENTDLSFNLTSQEPPTGAVRPLAEECEAAPTKTLGEKFAVSYKNFVSELIQKLPRLCECGADSARCGGHSAWCPKA